MAISTKYFALPALIGSGLTLAACGGAGSNEAIYEEFAKSCATSFSEEGGPAEMAEPFCDCSTAEVRAQELGPLDMINQEKMMAIGEKCMTDVLADSGIDVGGADAAPEAEAPAE